VRVVADCGFAALTHRAVAEAAGVSLASVTHHYPSIDVLRRAMFEHAGSAIGLDLVSLVSRAAGGDAAVPQICADFAVRLVSDRRVETAAVFEMIVAAGHDDRLRVVARFYQDRLIELFLPYTGDLAAARTVAAAAQGLLLTALSDDQPDVAALRHAVADLVRRFRRNPTS
jgi:DNA-binding transcriptional regulator YbjK